MKIIGRQRTTRVTSTTFLPFILKLSQIEHQRRFLVISISFWLFKTKRMKYLRKLVHNNIDCYIIYIKYLQSVFLQNQ